MESKKVLKWYNRGYEKYKSVYGHKYYTLYLNPYQCFKKTLFPIGSNEYAH